MPSSYSIPMCRGISPFAMCRALVLLCTAMLAGGCASVSVRSVESHQLKPGHTMPERVYVQTFEIPTENLRVDRNPKNLEAFQAQFSEQLAQYLTRTVNRSFAPAENIHATRPAARQNAWLVTGRIDRLNQGSRALRSLLGFGLGGTKMETTAEVYDLSGRRPEKILTVSTTGGSNSAPGAVTSAIQPFPMGAVGITMLASGVVVGAFPGLNADARRTAREITAAMSEYAYQQDLIPKRQRMRPKMLRKVQIHLIDPARPKDQPAPPQ